jgi:hypothetical protein
VSCRRFSVGNIIDKPLNKKRNTAIVNKATRYLFINENLFSLFFLITMIVHKMPTALTILSAIRLNMVKYKI